MREVLDEALGDVEAALAAEADVDQHHVLACANWPLSSSSSSSQIGGDCGCCRAAA
jgi:hypothetical protein